MEPIDFAKWLAEIEQNDPDWERRVIDYLDDDPKMASEARFSLNADVFA